MASKQDKAIKNTSDLREMLLETIQSVREGTLDPKQARTIAALATTILHSAKLDLDMLRFNIAHEGAAEAGKQVLSLVAG